MIPEDRAAHIVHRLLAKEFQWDVFERFLTSQQYPQWNQMVAYVADEIRAACKVAVEKELIAGKILRGEISADYAKELDARRWQEEYEEAQKLQDEEPDWGSLASMEARVTSLELRATRLERLQLARVQDTEV